MSTSALDELRACLCSVTAVPPEEIPATGKAANGHYLKRAGPARK